MIDKYKLHRIVEYMKQLDFEFETDEVIENLSTILTYYGLADAELTDEEYYFLISELLPLSERFEFREAEYLALQDDIWIHQVADSGLA